MSNKLRGKHPAIPVMPAHADLLPAAFDQAAVGMALRDLQGNWLRVNQKLCDMLGYTTEEFHALKVSDITPAGERRESILFNERMCKGDIQPYCREKRYLRKDGSVLDAMVTISAIQDVQGNYNYLLAVVQDISDRKTAELELTRYRENLEALVRARTLEFEQATEVAENANRAKSVFLSNISHELRTPLNAILGFAQLMQEDTQHPVDPSHRAWIDQVVQSGGHLRRLIEGVLDLSRIDTGRIEVRRESVPVGEMVRAALGVVAPQALEQGITLAPMEIESGIDYVLADPPRLQQVLMNLLSNAIKFNKAAGSVRVRVQRQSGNRVAISVSDTGLGMSAAQCEVLFTPFTRHTPPGEVIEGAGIGLALTKSLVAFMGGTITLESALGKGSIFTISLVEATADADGLAR